MPFVIQQACVGICDTGCVDVCPVDCIAGPEPIDELRARPPQERQMLQLFIDPDECTDCGACAPECPIDAIAVDVEADPQSRARNAAFFARRG